MACAAAFASNARGKHCATASGADITNAAVGGTGGDARAARPWGKTPRLRFGRRREAVGRRHSGDQRRRGTAGREKGNRRDGNRGSVQGRNIRRDAAEPGRRPEQRGSRALLWGRRERRHPRPRPGEKKSGATDGDRGNASNDAAVGGATLTAPGATTSGEYRSREEIGREQPEAPNSPRDNASAAFGDYSP